MIKVVLYLRYSSHKQNEQSIEGQERICRQYCEQNDMCVVGVYIDRALSASKNTDRREDFQRMIRESERGNFEAVIVYKLERFARNRYDSAIYKNKLKKNGVRVISAIENISDSPEGIILESVLEGMAEFYSMELAQKVTRGMHETALKCHSCGGRIPLGYKIENKKYIIDPLTAPIVKEAFQRYADGETITRIIEDFNKRGLRTSSGSEFNKNSFHNIFKNERYIGVYIYKDVRIEGGIPAIIDKELFDAVQARMKAAEKTNTKKKGKVDFLLTGKIFCGHCDTQMIGDSGTSKNGTTHYYYSCAGRKRGHSCDKRSLSKDLIEYAVVEDALELLTPENIEVIASGVIKQLDAENAETSCAPSIRAEIKEIEKAISNLLKLVERGSESEALFARLDELEKQKKAAETRLNEEECKLVRLEKKHVVFWLTKFAQGDPQDEHFRRQVIDMLVNSVTVWDEPDGFKITIVFNTSPHHQSTFRCSTKDTDGSPTKKQSPFGGCFFVIVRYGRENALKERAKRVLFELAAGEFGR